MFALRFKVTRLWIKKMLDIVDMLSVTSVCHVLATIGENKAAIDVEHEEKSLHADAQSNYLAISKRDWDFMLGAIQKHRLKDLKAD